MMRDNSLMRCVLTDAAAANLGERYEHRRRLWLDGPYGGSIAFDKVMEREVGLYIAYNFSDIPAFIRQAKLRGRLRHPHLLPVFDFGITADNLPYFTEPYVESLRLDFLFETSEDRIPVSLQQLVRAILGVCQAVAHAHERGICHLDLTPDRVESDQAWQDVFLTGGWEEVAVSPAVAVPRSDGISIKLAYAAPEQAQLTSQELLQQGRWRQVDVYGLGGIVYHSLYGIPPNRVPPGTSQSGGNLLQRLMSGQRVSHNQPLRPALRATAKVVRGLEEIALKALEPEPRRRYQTVDEMVRDLQVWLLGY